MASLDQELGAAGVGIVEGKVQIGTNCEDGDEQLRCIGGMMCASTELRKEGRMVVRWGFLALRKELEGDL